MSIAAAGYKNGSTLQVAIANLATSGSVTLPVNLQGVLASAVTSLTVSGAAEDANSDGNTSVVTQRRDVLAASISQDRSAVTVTLPALSVSVLTISIQ